MPFAGRLRDLAGAGALGLAAHRPLGDLLPLDLGRERPRGEDEPPDSRVLEALSHELELHAPALGLVEEHADVVLVAREPVDGVGEHDVELAEAHPVADARHARPLEGEAAGRIPNRRDHRPAGGGGVVGAGPELRVEGRAVPLLGVRRDAGVDDRAHGHLPGRRPSLESTR